MSRALDISNDDFIRTTEERHYRSSEEIWRRMARARRRYLLGRYAGWYSVRDEAFYAEKETTLGSDGVRHRPQGTPVEWFEEDTFFFRLSAYQDRLLEHYEKHPISSCRASGAMRS